METLSNNSGRYLNASNAVEQTLAQPTGSSTVAKSVSVLNRARNTHIKHSLFSINNNTTNQISGSQLEILYKSVAPNAILNSGGRADEVRCHPGTREEVIDVVEKSMDAPHFNNPRILWLSGPAGAGKTAIMQTIAERCKDRGVPHANFFFFRPDGSRNTAAALVATVIHQFIQLYPPVGDIVAAAVGSNPLIFQMDVQEQFEKLMHLPFTVSKISRSIHRPVVLLIDGLDECDSERKTAQRQVLQAIDNLLSRNDVSYRVVIASRVEPQIAMAFKQLQSRVDSIFLDEQYFPERDIRLFVTSEFEKIKSTHYLAHTLGARWPLVSDIEGVVTKSSGQFIYAATVMRFIAYSSSSPILSLQKVQGILPPAKNSPFAHLDAVYAYILQQVDNEEAVKAILASKLLVAELNIIKTCLEEYRPKYSGVMIDSCISELTPIVETRDGRLLFFHASFTDFLQEKSRAGRFHIDLEAFCVMIFPKLWKTVPGWLGPIRVDNVGEELTSRITRTCMDIRSFAILALQRVQRPNSKITATLLEADLSEFDHFELRSRVKDFVKDIQRLYAPHDPQSFIQIMRVWTSGNSKLAELFPQYLEAPEAQPVFRVPDWSAQVPRWTSNLYTEQGHEMVYEKFV
ncbi:hypothetical protein D9619_009482 [Psilocybe cf. subviscida]|uniref:NACHT domain-containing protein n=1 Tax=Psilocybe cf. subviscida TaxID=2480587 RepID=A0A8H5FAY9_9AGAR|nr:hypothetical protein D9619_009482 [Psilocybe cf. subviscida]